MSESAILCNTDVTTATAGKLTEASDGIRITYNKIKEANTELSESWQGKGGQYFTVMGEKMLKAIDESGIFTDEAAKTAFEIVQRFKEIDESSATILPEDLRGKCGLIDPMRNNVFLDPMFGTIPEGHFVNPVITPVVGPTSYGEIWNSLEPISGATGVMEISEAMPIGMATYSEGAFVGEIISSTSGWGVVVNPLLH